MKKILDGAFILSLATLAASPAIAGMAPVPVPLAGVGIGAIIVLGAGYRLLRGRIGR
ncbi:MAG: hypothetical protein AABZ45_07465 [Pseudomonadota bacterium]